MQDAENFLRQAQALKEQAGMKDGGNPALRHLLAVRHEVNAAAKGLSDRLRAAPAPAHAYAAGRCCSAASSTSPPACITARVPVVAVKMALGGFDTHANQVQPHERLLGFLANGLATLRQNLIAANLWNDVVVMTYSEFGRRAKQNASGGTDHGTAAPLFVMGGGVKGGLLRCLSVARRPAGRRPQAHRRLPQRLRHRGAGLLGPAARLRPAPAAEARLPRLERDG